VKKREWMKAKRYAVIYRREGGKHSNRFLQIIEKNMLREAATAFKAGSIAFRLEHLDQAVEHWRQAVALRPENMEYAHSLNRALQLQERLRILRSEADTANNHEETSPRKVITPSK
jgi:tetratricopeptide (TPR) repeat protein